MEIPEAMTPTAQLYFVVGAVAAKSAMIEDAAWSVSRALDGDFSLAVGQQEVPPISRVLTEAQRRLKTDARLEALADDAIELLGQVKGALKLRNVLVHKLWVIEDRDGRPEYRLLEESDSTRSLANGRRRLRGRPIEAHARVANSFDRQQRQLNSLKMAIADQFRTWRHEPSWLQTPIARMSRAMVRGEFDLIDGLPRLRDRDLAKELEQG